jgi:hypothetical protein
MNTLVAEPVAAPIREVCDQVTECPKEWQPSRQECLREYEVRLRFLTLGCVIEVGCKSIPFTTIKEGMEALNQYVAKPYETRQIWEKRFQEEEK